MQRAQSLRREIRETVAGIDQALSESGRQRNRQAVDGEVAALEIALDRPRRDHRQARRCGIDLGSGPRQVDPGAARRRDLGGQELGVQTQLAAERLSKARCEGFELAIDDEIDIELARSQPEIAHSAADPVEVAAGSRRDLGGDAQERQPRGRQGTESPEDLLRRRAIDGGERAGPGRGNPPAGAKQAAYSVGDSTAAQTPSR